MSRFLVLMSFVLLFAAGKSIAEPAMPTGALGVVIERATGSVLIIDRMRHRAIERIEGLGDLSHASVNFSPDERFAYVFGRDGGLTKIDGVDAPSHNGIAMCQTGFVGSQ